MTGPDRIEWRRSFPSRALRLVVWSAVAGVLIVTACWILFGDEPDTLHDGTKNPLADTPRWTLAAVILMLLLVAVPLVRRPVVAVSHRALSIRPGAFRTLVLPWDRVAEAVAVPVSGEEYLLVRLVPDAGGCVHRPRHLDTSVLRSVRRRSPYLWRYHLAVRLGEFTGTPAGNLAILAAYAPEEVYIADRSQPGGGPSAPRRA